MMDGGVTGEAKAAADYIARLDSTAETLTTPISIGGHVTWRHWGKGSPVILLHGGSGSWQHWVRNIEALSAHHTVYAPDIPGYGDSSMPAAPEGAITMAAELTAGIRTLFPGDETVAIVGFSFGGIVGGVVAATLGDQVRVFVAAGSAGLGLPFPPMEPLGRWRRLADPAEGQAIMRKNIRILMLAHDESIDELAMQAYEHGVRLAKADGRKASRAGVLKEALPDIKGKLGGIWGSVDAIASSQLDAIRRIYAETQADSDLRIIEGAGHWVAFEAADEFNRNLLELLA